MGMAPVAHVLFNKFMTFNPKNPEWVNRDRFVLSYVLAHILHFFLELRQIVRRLRVVALARTETHFRGAIHVEALGAFFRRLRRSNLHSWLFWT